MFISRFLCCVILHLELEAEVRASYVMIEYWITHRPLFDRSSLPFIYCMMKFIAASMTEIVNILLLCSQETVIDCILNYVAF